MTGLLVERAPAKVNLYLHVTGRRDDGYHLLESLVLFADCGDVLRAETAAGLSLGIDGPFGDGLSTGADNLVLAAAVALQREAGGPGAALHLSKQLPIASGIGGGSSDAAASLRSLNRLWGLDLDEAALERRALALGADVPVCIRGRARMMRGIGERLTDAPELPELHALLVNPLRGVDTATVFRRRDSGFRPAMIPPSRFTSASELCDWLDRETGTDLAAPAREIAPEIAEVEAAIARLPGVLLARMSGSGATCFGLCETAADAADAQAAIVAGHPGWWSVATRLG